MGGAGVLPVVERTWDWEVVEGRGRGHGRGVLGVLGGRMKFAGLLVGNINKK